MLTHFAFFKKLRTLGALGLLTLGFILPVAVLASGEGFNWRPDIITIDTGNALLAFFNIFWPIVVTIVLIMIIYSGLLFLSAQGDPTKTAEARKVLLWAIVGIIIIVLSGTIILFVTSFFGGAPICGVDANEQCTGTCGGGQVCSAVPGLGYRECACYPANAVP